MLGVFADVGLRADARSSSGGEIEVQFPIAPTERYRERVDERDHVAVVASLRPFFEPRERRRDRRLARAAARSAASSSATSSPATSPAPPIRSTAAASRSPACAAYSVGRRDPGRGRPRGHLRCPAERVLGGGGGGAARGRAGARASSRPASPRSAARAPSGRSGCSRSCARTAARLIGPNCLGIAVDGAAPERHLRARAALPPGNIGFSSQSGALGLALLEAAAARGLGLSAFVSIGNKADVSSNDLLEWWEDDPDTERRAALPRVVRQPAAVRAARAARRPPQADPRAQERRHDGAGSAPRARTRPRSPARRRRSTRSSARPA